MNNIRANLMAVLVAAILLPLLGCGPRDIVIGRAGLEDVMRTELHFAMSMPGGKTVSNAEWQAFVDAHITPRFKHGLTVIDATRRHVNTSKKLVTQPMKIVVLIHADTPRGRIDIFNMMSAYRTRFGQASVLRVTAPVGASF